METDIETLQKLLQEDPSNFQARRELAFILVNNGFNEEAEGNLAYLCKYFPDDAELFYNLGIVL
jgi:Flp pilus assembly protein TadD